jgi:16S rRNA (uracil1498-N3)-methyltransferase
MHRFFLPNIDSDSKILQITDKREIHHLKSVLRLKVKDRILVFDGKGKEAKGIILSFEKDLIRVLIENIEEEKRREVSIVLACAIPKKSKFESIIEKCTELGVDEIIPVKTKRTEVSADEERLKKKNLRFEVVAINTAKQCGRKTLPRIHPIVSFAEAIDSLDHQSTAFISSLVGTRIPLLKALHNLKSQSEKIQFFIGPEGDFTCDEIALALRAGCIPISLGKTILKVDTAAISVVSCANLFFHEKD